MFDSSSDSRLIRRIVRHYLRYDSDNPFIFISALLAFLGIAAGVMVLMIAMGIMNGTQKEFEKRLFVMNYPLTVVSYSDGVRESTMKKIEKSFPDMHSSPYYRTQVIVKNINGVEGALLYGVDFEKEAKINPVFKKALEKSTRKGKYRIVTGDDLAVIMGLDIGSSIVLYFSTQQAVGLGTMPLQKRFVVDGIFNSGLGSYDKAILYTTHEAFVKLLKKDPRRFDGVHIYTKEPMKRIDDIKKILPDDAGVEGWWQQNGNFFSAMQMEKKALFLVLLLIILVASLNIVSSLLMTVMSRRSEIALLRTLGATKKEIYAIFFRLGLIIGMGGITAGTLLGLGGSWILRNFDIVTLPADVYGTTHLPVELELNDFLLIIAGTVVIVFLSSIYPARKAAATDPLHVLRNE